MDFQILDLRLPASWFPLLPDFRTVFTRSCIPEPKPLTSYLSTIFAAMKILMVCLGNICRSPLAETCAAPADAAVYPGR